MNQKARQTRRAASIGAATALGGLGMVGRSALAGPDESTTDEASRGTAPLVVGQQRRQPNVLLVTIDTLRTDHVGPGGARGVETPVLDKLAAQGAYGAAYVQLPQTLPNHASILTGTYIQTHGLRTTLWDQARPQVPTLDQIFRRAGYRTAGIVSWYSFDNEFTNLVRAWDHWEQVVMRLGTPERVASDETRALFRAGTDMGKALDGDARTTTEAALGWLDANALRRDGGVAQPWFFWLHYRDPHYPFTPPPGFRPTAPVPAALDGGHESLGKITGGYAPTPGELAAILAAYDGEIAYTDAQLGRVMEKLDTLGLAQDTVVVVTGDHGESFLEHGPWDWLHGHSVYEGSVRVPLIVRYPAGGTGTSGQAGAAMTKPGVRFTEVVQSADIAPTVLELCGLAVPGTAGTAAAVGNTATTGTTEAMEARSFARLLAGQEEVGPERAAWGTIFDDSQSYVVQGEWKLIRWNDPARSRVGNELYHLASDPRETYDYRREVPDVAARLSAQLEGWLAAKDSGRPWRYWER